MTPRRVRGLAHRYVGLAMTGFFIIAGLTKQRARLLSRTGPVAQSRALERTGARHTDDRFLRPARTGRGARTGGSRSITSTFICNPPTPKPWGLSLRPIVRQWYMEMCKYLSDYQRQDPASLPNEQTVRPPVLLCNGATGFALASIE